MPKAPKPEIPAKTIELIAKRLGRAVSNPPSLDDLQAAVSLYGDDLRACESIVAEAPGKMTALVERQVLEGESNDAQVDAVKATADQAQVRAAKLRVIVGGLGRLLAEARAAMSAAEIEDAREALTKRNRALAARVAAIEKAQDFEMREIEDIATQLALMRSVSPEIGMTDNWRLEYLFSISDARRQALVRGVRPVPSVAAAVANVLAIAEREFEAQHPRQKAAA